MQTDSAQVQQLCIVQSMVLVGLMKWAAMFLLQAVTQVGHASAATQTLCGMDSAASSHVTTALLT